MAWDPTTALPSAERLAELGLADLAAALTA